MIMSGSSTLKNGVFVRFRAMLSWTGNSSSDIGHGLGEGGTTWHDNVISRWMSHRVKQTYFGYDMVIGEGDVASGVMVTFRPLTMDDGRFKGLSLTPILESPAPQIVHDGDTIELDLMKSPDGRQKLTDYIEFFSHEPQPPPARATDTPRDFTVDDGPVKFDGSHITVWKQGRQIVGMGSLTDTSPLPHIGWSFSGRQGSTFWVTFPGQGRYILSLAPHDGFVKAGAIRDNVITFEDAGQEYEVRFMTPIAGDRKAWNLYMSHDPNYELEAQRKSIDMGVDRLDHLLSN
jgi:hypothetical protein